MSSSLDAAVDALPAVDVAVSTDAALGAELVGLCDVIARLEGEWLRRLAVFDARGAGLADGAVSTAAWLRAMCRLAPGAARERTVTARRLTDTPATAAALAGGAIGYRHAVVVSTVTDRVGAHSGRPELATQVEASLLDAARVLDPHRLGQLAHRLTGALALELALRDANDAYDRRHLDVATTFEGMVAVSGMLDPEGGATLLTALAALRTPDPVGTEPAERRSPGQARADALVALARGALDAGELPGCAGERPHLLLTVDVTGIAGRPGTAGGTLEWVGPVTAEAVRRLGCDASLTRVLLAGPSEVLDVGRRTRVVPPALRRALVVRDGGCRFPGCDRPPPWTDAHHREHWADGGSTDLANLVLLCRRHHRLLHEGGWSLLGDANGTLRAHPPDPAVPASRRTGRAPPGMAA